ncbi:hypothetical protein C8Q73DRAFT_398611 [Cubamyces lactineus]|nr:hypothetical protein C8Q73DRAFT_398611 [Cubamyces lactineus]
MSHTTSILLSFPLLFIFNASCPLSLLILHPALLPDSAAMFIGPLSSQTSPFPGPHILLPPPFYLAPCSSAPAPTSWLCDPYLRSFSSDVSSLLVYRFLFLLRYVSRILRLTLSFYHSAITHTLTLFLASSFPFPPPVASRTSSVVL